MEDINAKRDARRKRILENSERRLLKIIGQKRNIELEGISCGTSNKNSFYCRDIQKEILQSNINGTIPDRCNDQINNVNIFKPDDIWNDLSTTSRNKYNDTRTEIEDTSSTLVHTNFVLPTILTNRINYVLLAFVVNILLMLKLDHIFGKAIAIPYFPVMMGRLYSCKNMQETLGEHLLYVALICICNINPHLMYQFKKFVRMLLMILEDLTLYIFSFTLIYYALLYCFRNTNILINLNV